MSVEWLKVENGWVRADEITAIEVSHGRSDGYGLCVTTRQDRVYTVTPYLSSFDADKAAEELTWGLSGRRGDRG